MKPFLLGGNMITQEKLKELFFYDKETGLLIWAITKNSSSVAGRVAGTITAKGYRNIFIDGKCYKAHRLIWTLHNGEQPYGEIDHVNHNRLDNRIENLRDTTRSENGQNQITAQSRSGRTSNLLGVHFNTKRNAYIAKIQVDGKEIYIGQFTNAEDAHAAYVLKKRKLHSTNTL